MIIGAALLMLAGCTAEEEADTSGLVPISPMMEIEGEIDGTTRAATSLLDAFSNEELGIALTNCVNASGSVLANTTYTAGTGFASQPYISPNQTATVQGYYPSSARTASSFTVNSDQTSDDNYKASDLMYASATATKDSPSPTLTFTHKMAKIIVNVTPASGVSSITRVTLNNISRTVAFTAGTGELGDVSSSDDITMSNGGAVLIPPQTTSESNNFLTIITDAGTAYYKLGKTFSGGSVYTLNISVGLSDIGLTTAITGWFGNESSVTVNPTVEKEVTNAPTGVVAVDLGLSVKWANMNVGATSETDYGTYFAWGETSGYTDETHYSKQYFSWDTYAWCKGMLSTLTKYCPTGQQSYSWWDKEGSTVTADNKTQLELLDDAACANWGGSWRMPTEAELTELSNTKDAPGYTWVWKTDYKGVSGCNGYLVIHASSEEAATASNSIFLPAAGRREGSSIVGQGEKGYFLSSSLNSSHPGNAPYLYLYLENVAVNGEARCYGYTVRPVSR